MYICNNCWNESLKWTGQCSFCKEWSSLVEFKESKVKWNLTGEKKQLTKMSDVSGQSEEKITTLSQELNNLLGGWITLWSIILLSWEPGIGKSTLGLQIAQFVDKNIIYISWEENENQIFARAKRLNIHSDKISLLCENNLENILKTLECSKSDIVVLDSISVITSNNASGSAGSVSQVKEVAEKIVDFWKSTNTTIIIIWHVTKDGNLAGPKTLEHLVDTVLFFEWERYEEVRILRSLKNRFGSTGEIALFKMTEVWLEDIKNPGLEFISSENDDTTPGSSLSMTLEWNRALVVEIESLTTYTKFGYPKRSTRGIPSPKLDLILAVLWKYSKVNLDSYDVYVNIVRWIKVDEPGIDMSIGASIISSKLGKPIKRNTIFIGEISLTGRIKNCFWIEKRIKEAVKLGFENIIIPDVDIKLKEKVHLIKIKNIWELAEKIAW